MFITTDNGDMQVNGKTYYTREELNDVPASEGELCESRPIETLALIRNTMWHEELAQGDFDADWHRRVADETAALWVRL